MPSNVQVVQNLLSKPEKTYILLSGQSNIYARRGEILKIKLMVSEEKYAEISSMLTEKGFEIDNNADFCFYEKDVYAKYIIGRKNGELYRIKTEDITYIESLSKDVIAHSDGEEYKLGERLVRLQGILNPDEFIRISNSVIVSVNHVRGIKPALSQKYTLTLSDGSKVDVTRSYYLLFKEFFGI